MNYRKVYTKCIRLGKEPTKEGAAARRKARQIKETKLDGKNMSERDEAQWKTLDMFLSDMYMYNYKYIPIKELGMQKDNIKCIV